MNIVVESLSETERKLTVELPKEKVAQEIEYIYSDLQKNAQVKGFRKGKAPKSILESYFNDRVEHDVVDKLVEDSISEALKEKKIIPVSMPQVEKGDYKRGENFKYSFKIEVRPEIKNLNYAGIKVEKKEIKVTEKEMKERIDLLLERQATMKTIETKRAVKKEDFAEIEYTDSEGKKGKDLVDLASEGVYLKEFRDNLIGMKKGEEKKIKVNFPKEFSNKDLAGKEKEYTVKLMELKEKELPKLDDEFVKSCGDYKNVEELKKSVDDLIKKEKENLDKERIRREVIDKLIAKNEISVPASMAEHERQYIVSNKYSELKRYGYTMTNDEIKKDFGSDEVVKEAQRKVKAYLLMEEIAKVEKIEIKDEDVNDRIKELAASLKMDYATVLNRYRENALYNNLRSNMLEDRLIDLIMSKGEK